MKRNHLFITAIILSLTVACNVDNRQTTGPVYQIDSIIISNVDTLGNTEDWLRFSITDDNIQTITGWLSNGSNFINYREHIDSINIELNQTTCASDPNTEIVSYLYIVNNQYKEAFNVNLIGCYGQEGSLYSKQHLAYWPDRKLNTLTNHFVYALGGGHFQESFHASEFSYDGNLLNAIDVKYIQYGNYKNDSILYSLTNDIIYPHQYSNQDDLIGLDLNDIILSNLIQNGLFSIPLIFNRKLSFNTRSDFLIEHIHFPQTPVYLNQATGINPVLNHPEHATDLNVDYEFENLNNNRIKSMTIRILPEINYESSLRYTFIYKN